MADNTIRNRRRSWIAFFLCCGSWASGCKSHEPESHVAVDAGNPIGIVGCDLYATRVEGCFQKDPNLKAARGASFDRLTAGWRRAATTNRDAVIFSCEEALKGLDVTMPTCK